jgi:hypothetical protein
VTHIKDVFFALQDSTVSHVTSPSQHSMKNALCLVTLSLSLSLSLSVGVGVCLSLCVCACVHVDRCVCTHFLK